MTQKAQNTIFYDWLKKHKALLFKVIGVYAFNTVDREDLFQEICIQIWRSIPNFKEESAVTTWIYRVALNTAIKWMRKEQKHYAKKQPLENIEHLLVETENQLDSRLKWLYKKIRQLDKIDRSLTLLMLDGYSYKEIAAMLGISESNVGVKIHRIKKYLIEESEKTENYEV